jgi:hypothetical protein
MKMTKFLWTGESEYCICGHHVTDRETSQWHVLLTERPIVICRGGDKARNVRACECDEFRPYRILGKEDDHDDGKEVIEKQIRYRGEKIAK